MAYPTKLTAKVQQQICDHVRKGGYSATAAAAVGVSRQTFTEWLRLGKAEPSGIYADFRAAVLKARAECEQRIIEQIAGSGDTADLRWIAERRYRAHWGRRDAHEVSGPRGGPIKTEAVARVVVLPELEPDDDDQPRGGVAPEPGPPK